MDHDYIQSLKTTHPAVLLLNSNNAPLVVSFLHKHFVAANRRAIPHSELVSYLDDEIFALREEMGEGTYPNSGKQYLADWCDKHGWLSKRYPERGDDPVYDLTPSTMTVIGWITGLKPKAFVGTESRLLAVFNLLREIDSKAHEGPEKRIEELERAKEDIEREIDKIRNGGYVPLSDTQIRERFFEADETARRLVSDFHQVEDNIRGLDRETRQIFVMAEAPRGVVLDDVLNKQDIIKSSDQGRSLAAFWEFLMNTTRQEELADLLESVLALPALEGHVQGAFLPDAKDALYLAGSTVYRTTNRLADQLRRYVSYRLHTENRRIMEIIRCIEQKCLELDEETLGNFSLEIESFKPQIYLHAASAITIPREPEDYSAVMLSDDEVEIDPAALFVDDGVDYDELNEHIGQALALRDQVSLPELLSLRPPAKGVAEIVGYYAIGGKQRVALVDESRKDAVVVDVNGVPKRVVVPRLIFSR